MIMDLCERLDLIICNSAEKCEGQITWETDTRARTHERHTYALPVGRARGTARTGAATGHLFLLLSLKMGESVFTTSLQARGSAQRARGEPPPKKRALGPVPENQQPGVCARGSIPGRQHGGHRRESARRPRPGLAGKGVARRDSVGSRVSPRNGDTASAARKPLALSVSLAFFSTLCEDFTESAGAGNSDSGLRRARHANTGRLSCAFLTLLTPASKVLSWTPTVVVALVSIQPWLRPEVNHHLCGPGQPELSNFARAPEPLGSTLECFRLQCVSI
ncbi:hypothetical protein HPB51_008468 [Rhipicephalus microplus]|uniref:Uncharacterized protein n=1 Tax=Rhipicephalus microplus TaxID=6941 RepID=A0A9J6ES87_RHIMP|nr:hypothetical protein HPB51_008468 [Rhipicephalus microplus]